MYQSEFRCIKMKMPQLFSTTRGLDTKNWESADSLRGLEEQDNSRNNSRLAHWGALVPLLWKWRSGGQHWSGRGQEHIARLLTIIWGTTVLVPRRWMLSKGSPTSPGIPRPVAEATGRQHPPHCHLPNHGSSSA